MNSPSIDVKDVLVISSLGTPLVFAENLFVSYEPKAPDEAVTIFDTGGESPDERISYECPTVQVKVRGKKFNYSETYSLIKNIAEYLQSLSTFFNVVVANTRYIGCWQRGDILHLGYDENNRPLFTANFILHRSGN